MKSAFTVLLVLFIDFVSKSLTLRFIPPFGGIDLIRYGIDFSLVHVANRGGAWGVFAEHHLYLLIARCVIVLALLIYLLAFNKQKRTYIPYAMIIGGAFGNIIDCFLYGHVIDMLKFVFWGYEYPVFNLADAAIVVGVTLLAIQSFVKPKGEDEDPTTTFRTTFKRP